MFLKKILVYLIFMPELPIIQTKIKLVYYRGDKSNGTFLTRDEQMKGTLYAIFKHKFLAV